MELSNYLSASTYSVQRALAYVTLQKTLNQDQQSVSTLISGLEKSNAKVMEASVSPHKGKNVDITL